ncbi:MAG: tol-pal system protein YbgF [Candidatus Tectomicrobia bacterium RIFCSPLOWO2_02_FULL_70_19]|nr:MAG: tol-pal system protein YbgF [Candidatus Tectomicrobia bacterium RIFCSPLOWO2_02_FULL_70_19]
MRMNGTSILARSAPWAAAALVAAGCAGAGPSSEGVLGRGFDPAPPAVSSPSASPGGVGEVRQSVLGLRRGLSNQEERIEESRKAIQGLVDGIERNSRNTEAALKKLGLQFEEVRGRIESLENEVTLLRQGRTGAPAPGAPAAPGAPPAPGSPPAAGAEAPAGAPAPGAPPAAAPPAAGSPPAAGTPAPPVPPQAASLPRLPEAPAVPPAAPAPKPPDPEEEFNQSLKVIQEEKSYPRGRALLSAFIAKFPAHELADDAQYWIGQTYFEERNYERAILAFNKVQVDYANGDKAPEALLQEGMSFLSLGDKASARELLMRLQQKYPNSEAARTAEERLKSMQ